MLRFMWVYFRVVLLVYVVVVTAKLAAAPIVFTEILATFWSVKPTVFIKRVESVVDSDNQFNDCWVNFEVYPLVIKKSYMLPNTKNLYLKVKPCYISFKRIYLPLYESIPHPWRFILKCLNVNTDVAVLKTIR